MDDTLSSTLLPLLKSPAWYVATFLIPILTDKGNNYLSGVIERVLKLDKVISEKPAEAPVAITATPEQLPRNTVSGTLSGLLQIMAKFARPVIVFIFFMYVLLNTWAVFSHVDKDPGVRMVRIIYTFYFLIGFWYNLSKAFGFSGIARMAAIEHFLAKIFIPVTYAHLVVLLYFIVHEYFFDLLVYTGLHSKKDGWVAVIVFLLLFLLGVVVLKDIHSSSGKTRTITGFGMLCVVLTYGLLLLSIIYKTSLLN